MPDATPRSIANSLAAFDRASKIIPGGVSSPDRAFDEIGGTPLFIKEAEGCVITDIDGNKYIDYVGSFGTMIVGHADERVMTALSKAIGRGASFAAPIESETQLAATIASALPAVEMVRFVNSGTEAVMSAIRLARAATGRDLIIKCAGAYHGHSDPVLVEHEMSAGVPKPVASQTIVVPYNDLAAARKAFEKHQGKIAGFIVEPVAGNMGVIAPAPGYLVGLRELCDAHGALLIIDEVMTGFRVAWGGAQTLYHVTPDLTCFGKIIGGGLPIGAIAGSQKLMSMFSPAGDVYQASTFSGNPVSMAGGIATLEILKEPGTYETLEERSAALANGFTASAKSHQVPITINRVGSMLCVFFTRDAGQPITNHAEASACDTKRFATFFNAMLDRGVYIPHAPLDTWFVSLAHTDEIISRTIDAANEAFKVVAGES